MAGLKEGQVCGSDLVVLEAMKLASVTYLLRVGRGRR